MKNSQIDLKDRKYLRIFRYSEHAQAVMIILNKEHRNIKDHFLSQF